MERKRSVRGANQSGSTTVTEFIPKWVEIQKNVGSWSCLHLLLAAHVTEFQCFWPKCTSWGDFSSSIQKLLPVFLSKRHLFSSAAINCLYRWFHREFHADPRCTSSNCESCHIVYGGNKSAPPSPPRHPINELQVSMAEMGDTCTSASRNKHANMYLIKMVLG